MCCGARFSGAISLLRDFSCGSISALGFVRFLVRNLRYDLHLFFCPISAIRVSFCWYFWIDFWYLGFDFLHMDWNRVAISCIWIGIGFRFMVFGFRFLVYISNIKSGLFRVSI